MTDELAPTITDRVPELLAILVHHSLGVQTLELGSDAFETRANRLRRLRVRQLDNLVIDATVEGTDITRAIGETSDQDLFLEAPTSAAPTLYIDLGGDDWQEQLRRKIAPHLATLLQSPAYAATFTVFLLADTDGEREAILHDLGITGDDVNAVRTALGIVSEEDRRRQSIWYSAIVAAMTDALRLPDIEPDSVLDALLDAGLSRDVALRLLEFGDADARGDVSPDGPLSLLRTAGVDLAELDARLRAAGDPGLDIRVARHRLRAWIQQNERRAAAVLMTTFAPEAAKSMPAKWRPPHTLAHELEPTDEEWLRPALDALRDIGLEPNATALAEDAPSELSRLLGVASVAELDERVLQLYDADERGTALRRFAATWRRHLILLGILSRVSAGDGRSAIRAHEASVQAMLPPDPADPAELRPAAQEILGRYPKLVEALWDQLTGSLSAAPPAREWLRPFATAHGLPTEHLDAVIRAIEAPRNAAVREIRERIAGLVAQQLEVLRPDDLRPPDPKKVVATPGPRKVRTVKVGAKSDKRKREVGDDAERWALAALTSQLVDLAVDERQRAIGEILRLLDGFQGAPVDAARTHALPASDPALDDDELIEELSQLLHLSPYSDDFGFDMLGWSAPHASVPPRAMCVEVKGTRDGSFHLSRGEWACAQNLRADGLGESYAVLVVHRSLASAAPIALDLLADPVDLVETGQLSKEADGYLVRYRSGA